VSVKLRLRRIGRKKIPVFSIIATDSRNARDGRYIEDLGRYYPLEQPAEVQLDEERILYWLDNGAKPSDTVRSILSKRGLMLWHHLKLKGKSEDEIREKVNEHLKQLAEKGDDIKVTAKMRRENALEAERERARQREQEAQERAQVQQEAAAEATPVDTSDDADEAASDEDEPDAEEPDAPADANDAEDAEAAAEPDDAQAEDESADEAGSDAPTAEEEENDDNKKDDA
jgi:small subunit ribosomal protein S16